MRRIEEESAKNRYVQAVRQNGQVRLRELERWGVLVHQLPHAVQEEQEQGCLREDKTHVMEGCQRSRVQGSHLDSRGVASPGRCMLWEAHSR